MGLDMYAYKVIAAALTDDDQVDVNIQSKLHEFLAEKVEPEDSIEEPFYYSNFAYWRKFNSLHGWMEHLYYTKGGTNIEFNCNNVRLTNADLDQLECDAKNLNLEPTTGFFFGTQKEFDEEDKEEVMTFVNNAREAIKEGYAIFYDSWW